VLPGNACEEEAVESKNEECRGEEDQGGVVFSFSVPSATRTQITAKTKPLATPANVDCEAAEPKKLQSRALHASAMRAT
jgi:hypothetical protein